MASSRFIGILLALWIGAAIHADALPKTWDGGGGNSDWFTDANWSGDARPAAGDDVTLGGGVTVILSSATPDLGSFTITNATLVFTNWTTFLLATSVTVQATGKFSLPIAFTNGIASNRIYVLSTNFTLDAGGLLDAVAKGYAAATGPGAGQTAERGAGGGYGGRGAWGDTVSAGGTPYGSPQDANAPGSGGCGSVAKGGPGGGAVKIVASGTCTINGAIYANGTNSLASYGGGGSGGGVDIRCGTFAGSTSGVIQVKGGRSTTVNVGSGGGGRIVVDYASASPWPGVRFAASPGTGGYIGGEGYRAAQGTLFLSDLTALRPVIDGDQFTDLDLYFGSGISWATDSLTVSNSAFRIAVTNFTITVTNALTVGSRGHIGLFNLYADSVLLTNGGQLSVQSDATNGVSPDYGALVAVTGTVEIAPASALDVSSEPETGGSPLFRVNSLTVQTGGLVRAEGTGFKAATGPGAGETTARRSGGSYGGKGGRSDNGGKAKDPYGSPAGPPAAGSGGCFLGYGGFGGGLIRVEATDTIRIDGTVSANGGRFGAAGGYYGGGGSGGGIFLTCSTFAGSTNGLIQANGGIGNNVGGRGGGGRIAIHYLSASPWPRVRISAAPATAGWGALPPPYRADQGTLYVPDAAILSTSLDGDILRSVTLYVTNMTAWALDSLTLSNIELWFGPTNFAIVVTNDLTVDTSAVLSAANLDCGGTVQLTNGGTLWISANPTNGLVAGEHGALLSVTQDIDIATSSWLRLVSHPANGGSPLIRAANTRIAAGGGIGADDWGFKGATGPGAGDTGERRRGGGYGGRGGTGTYAAVKGLVNGSTNAPLYPGSGGGLTDAGGYGGGLLRLETGALSLDGTLSADGGDFCTGNYAGGGSGGAILILCSTLSGSASGLMRAEGGNGASTTSGGGGGGRISVAVNLSPADRANLIAGIPIGGMVVYYAHAGFDGTLSSAPGVGYAAADPADRAQPGTWQFLTAGFSLTIEGDPGNYGAPHPNGYGTHIDIPSGAWVTNTVATPADEAAGLRRSCLGWTLAEDTNGVVASSTSTQAVLQLTNNLTLTWRWTNEWLLSISAGPDGSVNDGEVNGWYTNGVEITNITATPSTGYYFSVWTGVGVPAGQESANPLAVTMDQARTIQASFASLSGTPKAWSGNGLWESATNWSPAGMPGPLDPVTMLSGTAFFANARSIGSLTVSNGATLLVTNWDAALSVTNAVTILGGGRIELAGGFPESGPSSRLDIACADLLVETNGVISADGGGYATLSGPGKGANGTRGSGGGHGGRGGMSDTANLGGPTYGSTNEPSLPGSGGGNSLGGAGGGVIRIAAAATVTVHGTISANGAIGGSTSGGGSGGSIWITCGTFGGSTSGLVRANGGRSYATGLAGGGGGGRIAVHYATLTAPAEVRFATSPGTGWADAGIESYGWENAAQNGSLYLSDRGLLAPVLDGQRFTDVSLYMSGVTSWAVGSLTVSNCSLTFAEPGFGLTVSNDLLVGTAGELGGRSLTCGGSVSLTNGGVLNVCAEATNGTPLSCGAAVIIAGDLSIATNSWLCPFSDEVNGGSVRIRARNLLVAHGGGIKARGRGYGRVTGPGHGLSGTSSRGGGGSHGGLGGIGSTAGATPGPTYGSTNAPLQPGSGGGNYYGGAGGGLIWVETTGLLSLGGTLTADGGNAANIGGGGSGGGLFLATPRFLSEPTALLSAGGGGGSGALGGGGGGGRIAIWYQVSPGQIQLLLTDPDGLTPLPDTLVTTNYEGFAGTALANGSAVGYTNGLPGTVVFLMVPPPKGVLFLVH